MSVQDWQPADKSIQTRPEFTTWEHIQYTTGTLAVLAAVGYGAYALVQGHNQDTAADATAQATVTRLAASEDRLTLINVYGDRADKHGTTAKYAATLVIGTCREPIGLTARFPLAKSVDNPEGTEDRPLPTSVGNYNFTALGLPNEFNNVDDLTQTFGTNICAGITAFRGNMKSSSPPNQPPNVPAVRMPFIPHN